MAEQKRVRRHPDERRSELVDAARGLYLQRGYGNVVVKDIADAVGVSRGLVYNYFKEGQPEVFVAVVEDLADQLHKRLAHAARSPFSAAKRMEDLLAVFFAFFVDDPDAYRLLVQEVWTVREPPVVHAVHDVYARLRGEIAEVVAFNGGSAEEVLLIAAGILGCAFANVELALRETVDTEVAWRVTCGFAVSQLER